MTVTRVCSICGYRHDYATEALADAHHPRHSCARQQRRAQAARRRAERAAGGPKRDCAHPGHPHRHGQRVAYVKDRCRCAACTAANTAEWRAAVRDQTIGAPRPYVDAAPARAQIGLLRAAGIGYDQIARLAHTSGTHIREIAQTAPRSAGRPPIQQIRRELADRLLAIAPVPANRAPHSQVDGVGTRRRLQALIAIGHRPADLAAQLGRSVANLRRTMTGARVTARTAQLVSDLYEQTWDTAAPHATDAQREASAAVRAMAAEHGWRPPLAWDDIDADPDPDPHAPAAKPDPNDIDEIAVERAVAGDGIRLDDLTHAEQAEVVRRLTERGKSIRDIADQLATTKRTVSRRREAAASAA
jgi:hypothetical protein